MSFALVSPSIRRTVSITLSWAKKRRVGAYFWTFQTITLWSSEPLTNVCPSLDTAKRLTQPSWPVKVRLQ